MLEFRLLGPVQALVDGQPVALGGVKPQALLATLVLERDRLVSTNRLVEVVWRDNPPASARSLVQTYVSTLRRSFAERGVRDLIVTMPSGYQLRRHDAWVDAEEFARLREQARQESRLDRHALAASLLRDAIGMWRGPALSGLAETLLYGEARRLDELRVTALEERFAAELRLGRLDQLAELTGAVARHPANERLRGQLMMTLYHLGRQADALACYREGREALIEELGVEPGAELSSVHAAILRGTLKLVPAGAPTAGQTALLTAPAQLPAAPADFTGRDRELAALLRALRAEPPAVQTITGLGGCGKSVLTVRAAHLAAPTFPDGQLYAELRGMSDSPATPGEVLGRFLRALGVDVRQLPDSTQERQELYRTLLSRRRVLVVLDDVASEDQVRPLLPGAAGSAMLLNSRDRLAGLAGATLTELDVLAPDEAHVLLRRIVGDDRLANDIDAAERIVTACGRLPLALRIAGARLASRAQLPPKVLADRLADERHRLDELSAGDLAVRSSIALSYRGLDEQARTALGRMAHLGLPEFSTWVVSWLLAMPVSDAEKVLEMLVDAQLAVLCGVDAAGVLRYRLHDLVRLYARERAEADQPAQLTSATARVFDGWTGLLRRTAALSPPAGSALQAVTEHVDDHESSDPRLSEDITTWLNGEEPAMAIAIERAGATGLHQQVYDLVSAHATVEHVTNRYEFRDRIIGMALTASRRSEDAAAQAQMLTHLAQLRYAQDRFGEAVGHFDEALSRFRELRDVRGQAVVLAGMGLAWREPGHLTDALGVLCQATALWQALDDQAGIGHVLRVRGSVHLERGDYPAAFVDLTASLDAYHRVGSRRGVALSLRSLGLYHRARGEYDEALAACAEAAEIFAELGDDLMHSYAVRAHAKTQLRLGLTGQALPRLEASLATARDNDDRWGQAATLRVLGQLHLADGRLDLARNHLDAALSIWDTMEAPLWRSRTEYDLSLLHRLRGDTAAADATLAAARDVFLAHGAREYTESVL